MKKKKKNRKKRKKEEEWLSHPMVGLGVACQREK
jgi:hypothetical protein